MATSPATRGNCAKRCQKDPERDQRGGPARRRRPGPPVTKARTKVAGVDKTQTAFLPASGAGSLSRPRPQPIGCRSALARPEGAPAAWLPGASSAAPVRRSRPLGKERSPRMVAPRESSRHLPRISGSASPRPKPNAGVDARLDRGAAPRAQPGLSYARFAGAPPLHPAYQEERPTERAQMAGSLSNGKAQRVIRSALPLDRLLGGERDRAGSEPRRAERCCFSRADAARARQLMDPSRSRLQPYRVADRRCRSECAGLGRLLLGASKGACRLAFEAAFAARPNAKLLRHTSIRAPCGAVALVAARKNPSPPVTAA